MSDNNNIFDQIDETIKSSVGEVRADISEFLFNKTKKLLIKSKGAFGLNSVLFEPYPIIYSNPVGSIPESESDLFNLWFSYFDDDTLPRIYVRWALISLVAALLEKNVYLQEGSNQIFPNMYIALIGDSGTGKTSTLRKLLEFVKLLGYGTAATGTTTKEKFIEDLYHQFKPDWDRNKSKDIKNEKDLLDLLDGDMNGDIRPGYIIAEEWKDFFKGSGQFMEDWIAFLEKVFDNPDTVDNRIRGSKGTVVHNPCVNLLGAATPDAINNFTRPVPFVDAPFSGRTILIYSPVIPKKSSTEKMILSANDLNRNPTNNQNIKYEIVRLLGKIRDIRGKIVWEEGVREFFDYLTTQAGNRHVDTQHTPYYNRRDLHLKKLCIIFAAIRGQKTISKEIVIEAEEILLFAESFLPIAVGFPMYGNSDYISKRILQLLNRGHLTLADTLPNRISAVIPDREKFEKQKNSLISSGRIKEVVLTIKNPMRKESQAESFYMSQLMDYRLRSVIKDSKDVNRIYEYYLSISEILDYWKKGIDIEEISE